MTYQKANHHVVGRGKMRKRIPRVLGASEDRLLSVMVYGKPGDVRRLEFMSPWGDKVVLARNMVVIRVVITDLYPDWDGHKWMSERIPRLRDDQPEENGPVLIKRVDVYGQSILFVDLK